jgi:hypothetical protein
MNTLYKNNQPAITNPDWSFRITIPSGSVFDGTASETDPLSARVGSTNDGSWPWADGFLIKPTADITDLTVVPYSHYYVAENKNITNAVANAATTENFLANIWNETRIIYINNTTGGDITINIGA